MPEGRGGEPNDVRLAPYSGSKSFFLIVAILIVAIVLGDRQNALDALERAFAARMNWFALLNVDERFDELHDDPRFEDLMRRGRISPTR